MPNVEKDHEEGATHYCCEEILADYKDSDKIACCACSNHPCKQGWKGYINHPIDSEIQRADDLIVHDVSGTDSIKLPWWYEEGESIANGADAYLVIERIVAEEHRRTLKEVEKMIRDTCPDEDGWGGVNLILTKLKTI